MGLFGKMFEKKNCTICGKELGVVFGKAKIEDGHICKDCEAKLSPFFQNRRHSTTAQIQEQLNYREANKPAVAAFHATRTIGSTTKVYIDEDASKFIVTDKAPSLWADANPDVLDFSQVTGADYEVDEREYEETRTNSQGEEVSYNPPRYRYETDIYCVIYVSHPYFERIRFRLNPSTINGRGSAELRKWEDAAREIKEALTSIRTEHRASMAPKTAVTCPHCGATTMPDANGRCEYCGGAIG